MGETLEEEKNRVTSHFERTLRVPQTQNLDELDNFKIEKKCKKNYLSRPKNKKK